MSKKKGTEEKTLVGLVNEWVNLDNPESIKRSVRKWTSNGRKDKNSSRRGSSSNEYVSILTQPYSHK